jgi:rhodanese-related sulfurtransferase
MLQNLPELVNQIKETIQTTSAKNAYLLARKQKSLFIDVREGEEVAESPIVNSINLPRGLLEMKITQYCSDDNLQIFLHCASGGRATFAAEQLVRLGYKNVWAITCSNNHVHSAQKESSN